MLKKFSRYLGIIAAPITYCLYRVFRKRTFLDKTISMDSQFPRAYLDLVRGEKNKYEPASRLFLGSYIFCSYTNEVEDYFSILENSESQVLQDVVCILSHRLKIKGYFVEIGVGNGRSLSNTYMLEKKYDWNGLLLEPARTFHESILQCRSSKLDRRAASGETGKSVRFEQDENNGELSGVLGHRTGRGEQELATYNVETVTLDDLLDEYAAPETIDYMSIDTEGSELEILKGLSLEKRKIMFFSLEHNHDEKKAKKYHEILTAYGYLQVLPSLSRFDCWYAHPSLAALWR